MTTSSAGSNKSGAKPAVVAEVTSPTDANRRSDKLLKSAWDRHDIYNHNASQAQKRFFFVRQLLACLSVAVVFLSVLQPIVRDRVIIDNVDDLSLMFLVKAASQQITLGNPFPDILWLALIDFSLILLPIFTTGLLAFAVKFDRGNNWILLRGNSETLRMEIFYYRTGVKQYQRNRNAVLAERIKMISERGKGSSIHQSALSPYEGQQSLRIKKGIIILIFEKTVAFIKIILDALWNVLFQYQEVEVSDESTITADAGPAVEEPQPSADYMQRYADLDANSYIRYRLEDQFNWYRRKAKVYDQGYQILQTSVYIFGGMGTLLAAIGFQNWVAVTAS